MKNIWSKILLSIILIVTMNSATYNSDYEYKIYSLYLYKFSQLVEWPAQSTKKEFVIGVIGISPLIPELEKYVNSKNSYSAMKYKVVRISVTNKISNCDLLFITKAKSDTIAEVVKNEEGRPTLIVTEQPGLIKRGACVNMISEEGSSLKIQINKSSIASHRLKASSDLIKLSHEVF